MGADLANLADPTETFDDPMRPGAYTHVPNYREMQQAQTRVRKTLAELPLPPEQMNTISVVVMYSLVGIAPHEIAEAIGVSREQVDRLIKSDAYRRMHDDIIQRVLDTEGDDVRTIIAANARNAVQRVAGLVDDGDPTIALSASKDILDRAGHRPADRLIVEGMDELRIRIVQDEKVPVIDVTPRTKE